MVTFIVGDGVDGVTICHRMDGPGFEHPVWIRHLLVLHSRPVWSCCPISFYDIGYQGSFLGVKRPGRDVHHPSPSIERRQICMYGHTQQFDVCVTMHRFWYNDVNNQQDATTFSFINLFISALHVSGDKFAHPQEQFLTI